MSAQPTYDFYEHEYAGNLNEEAFNASLRVATAYVNDFIWPNEEDGSDEYQRAVCAAVDVDATYGASGGIGESMSDFRIGSFSVSGSEQQGGTAYEQDVRTAIKRELLGTGLLYMGIG